VLTTINNFPKLNLCSSLSKTKLSNRSGVVSMLSCLKSTHAFKQEFYFRLELTILTFKLTHITFDYGTCSLHLGLGQLKDRMVKSSTMSRDLCSTIILEFLASFFRIKLRNSFVWPSQVSQYVVFMDPHWGNNGVIPFCLPTTKAYMEFIGREKARAYLQCIYCKVKQWIERELSYTIKSRCTYVWIYDGYIWWLILILLCSLKIYLSFET
jgi:hypothetical protein